MQYSKAELGPPLPTKELVNHEDFKVGNVIQMLFWEDVSGRSVLAELGGERTS